MTERNPVLTTAPWRTVEITVESERSRPNPYLDVEVTATFTGPAGEVVRRPAFWDGGATWRVRFAPTRPGDWRYRVESDDPADAGLNRISGDLACVEADDERAVYAHGFLRPDASGHHLTHADGTPFFWLGDTHWRFAWERWDEANKPGWSSQFRGIVDRRVEQGFTVYQSNLMSFGGSWDSPPCWLPGREYKELDPSYFKSIVDPRMAYVADRGLVNALGLGWYTAIDSDVEGLARFARYVVARYGSYPMVWILGGEIAGYEPELRQRRIDGWREVALAIRDADGYDQPRTAHLTNERPLASYYQGEDWLTLTLNQLGHGDLDLGVSHYGAHLDAHPGVPLVEGESLYEGLISVEPTGRRPVTDTMVRQVAYRAIQSGCCGYTYGAQGCWNGGWDRDEGSSMWGDLPWYEGIDLPGAVQLGHLRRFYESVDWASLRPVPDAFVPGSWVNASFYPPNVSADQTRRLVVVYFGETYRDGEGVAALTGLQAMPYRLRWFDPRAGEFRLIDDGVVPADGRVSIPDKPDLADWLLVAEAADGRPAADGKGDA